MRYSVIVVAVLAIIGIVMFLRNRKAGVEVVYHSCHVEADRIWITGTTRDTSRYRNQNEGDLNA